MSDRLAEIQRHIDTEPVTLYGLDVAELAPLCIQVDEDRTWLLARVRELEAQAVRDAKVIEAARAYRIAQRAIASACSPPFDPGVCTDAMVAQDEAEATLDAALAAREE